MYPIMPTEKAGRLSLELEERGLLINVRKRPSGFSLKLSERPLIDKNPTPLVAPHHATVTAALVALGTGAQPLLQLGCSVQIGHVQVERTLRCPLKGTAEASETFDIEYNLRSTETAELAILRIAGASDVQSISLPNGSGLKIQAFPYDVILIPHLDASTKCVLVPDEENSYVDFVVRWSGEKKVLVCVYAVSLESRQRDAIAHIVTVPFDFEMLALATSVPPALGSMLQYLPQGQFLRPPSTLIAISREASGQPLRLPPMLDLLRMSTLAICYGEPPLTEFVRPLLAALEALPVGRRASLWTLLWLTCSPEFATQLRNYLGERGPVRLGRLESHLPEICENIVADARSLRQPWKEIRVAMSRMREVLGLGASSFDSTQNPLPAVVIPTAAPLAVQLALLGASRLRSTPPEFQSGREWAVALSTIWPKMPRGADYLLCAEIADCVTTDVYTHEVLSAVATEGLSFQDARVRYDVAWNEVRQLVSSGNVPTERVILLALKNGGQSNLLRSLPALFCCSDVPAPVLPFLVSEDLQKEIDDALVDCCKVAEDTCEHIVRGRGLTDAGFWLNADKSRVRLQTALAKALPKSYIEWIARNRPREILAFANLPLEWLEIDGIPLGYLSKVSKLRSESRYGELSGLFDMVRVYNSLNSPEYRRQGESFEALGIAPLYSGKSQELVNRTSQEILGLFNNALHAQIQVGREINIETVTGFGVDANQIGAHLERRRDLIFYIGHAGEGKLVLEKTAFDVGKIKRGGFEGTVVVLLGCTTEDAQHMSESIANEFIALGARAVFAIPFKLDARVADEIMLNLFAYLMKENWHFAEVLQAVRWSVLHTCAFLHTLGLRFTMEERPEQFGEVRDTAAFISPADGDYERFRDNWDRFYRHEEEFFRDGQELPVSGTEVVRRAALTGMAFSFSGDLRDRLFVF